MTTATIEWVELPTTDRDNTLTPRGLRSAGFIPATVYGKSVEPRSIQVPEDEFMKLYLRERNRRFRLKGPDIDITAQVQEVQVNPVNNTVISIQFWHKD